MSRLHKGPVQIEPLQTGQLWQLADSHLRIGHVGKTLVHYKHWKGSVKRGPNQISAKTSLERFLKVRKATLVREQAQSASA